jgi:hypothetical protein
MSVVAAERLAIHGVTPVRRLPAPDEQWVGRVDW